MRNDGDWSDHVTVDIPQFTAHHAITHGQRSGKMRKASSCAMRVGLMVRCQLMKYKLLMCVTMSSITKVSTSSHVNGKSSSRSNYTVGLDRA